MAKPAAQLKILVANGVNLDLLGSREPDIYGKFDLQGIEAALRKVAAELAACAGFEKIEFEFYQSNSETEFLEYVAATKCNGVILNPAAWTHTSVALADRLAAQKVKFVEVHISNLAKREEFRKTSYTAAHALGVVYGFGIQSYVIGLYALVNALAKKAKA